MVPVTTVAVHVLNSTCNQADCCLVAMGNAYTYGTQADHSQANIREITLNLCKETQSSKLLSMRPLLNNGGSLERGGCEPLSWAGNVVVH